ncbi:MAG: hypothetical protein U0470_00305 [Anaerolineae bacterium]
MSAATPSPDPAVAANATTPATPVPDAVDVVQAVHPVEALPPPTSRRTVRALARAAVIVTLVLFGASWWIRSTDVVTGWALDADSSNARPECGGRLVLRPGPWLRGDGRRRPLR